MLCKDIEALWAARTEGDLSSEMEAMMNAHLDGCSDCQKMVAALTCLEYSLEGLGEYEVETPPYLKARVMAMIKERRPSLMARLMSWASAPRLIAASLVFIAFFGGMVTREMILNSSVGELLASRKITLEFDAPGASQVGLVGDFNNWGQKAVPIKAEQIDGKWVFELSLEPGRYQYSFVVDGKKWLPDPNAAGIIPDGFGGKNSLLYVNGGDRATLL
ncbi:MAG: hypothetical protein C0608_05075 [Deltaproteobacteria bacterium]|nr:MAG: hypothetical protein C0608_05075 [Deltaproteobacteria bacterium]